MVKNQDNEKVGQIFLTSLTKLANNKHQLDHRLLQYQFDVFESLIVDLTGTERLLFNTLFARIAFLGIQFKLPSGFLYELHLYRKEKLNLHTFTEFKQVYELGLYLIGNLLTKLYQVEIPAEIQKKIIKPEYEKNDPVMDSYKLSIRGLITTFDPKLNQFEFISDTEPDVKLLMDYSQLDLFQKSLINLKKWQQINELPVTVELREVGIDKDGVLHPNWIIIEPDYLIDVTAVAECFMPNGANSSYYLLRKFLPVEPNKYLLIGHLVNYVLDELLHDLQISFEKILKHVFMIAPLSFTLLSDQEVLEIVRTVKTHFMNLKRVIEQDFPGLELHPERCVVEPSFYAPQFGIQGRIDVLYKKAKNESSIIELKSGSPFRENMYGLSVNHYTQTLLYDLMVRSVYNYKTKPLNYILYSKLGKQNLRFAPTVKAAQMEAISVRNDIYAIERKMTDNKGVSDLLKEIRIVNFTGAYGFLKSDIERFEKMYQSLDSLEQSYFNRMSSFITLEHHLAKTGTHNNRENNGMANMWLGNDADKLDNFSIYKSLMIVDNQSMEDSPLITLTKTENSNELANFRVGDIIILRPHSDEPIHQISDQVIRASLVKMDHTDFTIKLRSKQYDQQFFKKHKFWNLEPDFLDSGFRKMFHSLFYFGNVPKEKRDLLIGRRPPDSERELEMPVPKGNLTENQYGVLNAMLSSKDYFLLWGPPGTGKTSILLYNAVAYLLENTEQNILLLAYTNRAVDEICQALEGVIENTEQEYIRIGSRYATGDAYSHRLLDVQMEQAGSRNNLKNKITQTRIFTGTTSSLLGKTELFRLKKFDLVIIDEASQILEPMILGILPNFNKFILIGDHKQLPAVVVQDERHSQVNDEDLKAIDLTDCRLAYFERLFKRCRTENWHWAVGQLNEQGRMHQDIQAFVNTHFYNGNLQCLPFEKRQFSELEIPEGQIGNQLFKGRMLYINTEFNDKLELAKNNSFEALLVAKIIVQIQSVKALNRGETSALSIGVITPFRAQIAQIRDAVKSLNIDLGSITIDTVERYQGGASDIIIYSTVVNSVQRLEQIISLDENGDDRKLNVVVSRAREQLILLGNKTILNQNGLYKRLMETCVEINYEE